MASEQRFIYMDHAATTAVDPRVVEAMLPYWTEEYGNPSSIYRFARGAHEAMERARAQIAEIMGARTTEVYFTSCGTESDNLALRGVSMAQRSRGRHIITTPIEHHAVGYTCEQLEHVYGMEVTTVPVDRDGMVDPDDVGRAIRDDTVLISVMYANNEVGTIEPIEEISQIARAYQIPFHSDAVQAGGNLDLNVDRLGVDLLALSGHKIYGPKGVGVLYVRQGTPILPTQTGGGQERRMRAGTENVAFIVGLGKAMSLAYEHLAEEAARQRSLRERLVQGIVKGVPGAQLTGHPTKRLPNHASFVFPGAEGEAILLQLDLRGIAASTGSACSSGEDSPSPVLTAMGYDAAMARGSLRLTMGRENTIQDVDDVLTILPEVVHKLRAMSPIYESSWA